MCDARCAMPDRTDLTMLPLLPRVLPNTIRAPPPPEIVLPGQDAQVHAPGWVAGAFGVALLSSQIGDDVLRAPVLLVAHLRKAGQLATSGSVDPDGAKHVVPILGVVLEGHPRLAKMSGWRTRWGLLPKAHACGIDGRWLWRCASPRDRRRRSIAIGPTAIAPHRKPDNRRPARLDRH